MATDDEPPTPPTEREVKFLLPVGAEAALDAHPTLGTTGAWETRREVTTYFDTPGEEVARLGGSLRVREGGGRTVQTLKLRGTEGDPFGRGEWEWPLDGTGLDPRLLDGTPLAHLGAADGFRPVFMVELERSVREVRLDGAVVELARDIGTIRAGEAAEDIRELELELKAGAAGALYRFALALAEAVPLRLGAESKSDRGWRLRHGKPRAAGQRGTPDLRGRTTGLEALRRIVASGLADLLAGLPSATAGEAGGVHAMRIAVRRLRTALALFRPHLEPEAEARFTGELRRLGRALGEPRDWDVFCTETLDAAVEDGVAPSLIAPLRHAAEERRAAAHRGLAEELATGSLTALALGLMTWVEDPVALTGSPGGGLSAPVADLAPRLEARLERRVLRRGRHIRRLDEEGLHDLRKALKRLRYAVEFTAPLHRAKRVRRYLGGCKSLQEALGTINDAAVAGALASDLAEGRADLAPAVDALRDRAGRRQRDARRHLRKAWRRFREEQLPG